MFCYGSTSGRDITLYAVLLRRCFSCSASLSEAFLNDISQDFNFTSKSFHFALQARDLSTLLSQSGRINVA
jgi:hypothetical protein